MYHNGLFMVAVAGLLVCCGCEEANGPVRYPSERVNSSDVRDELAEAIDISFTYASQKNAEFQDMVSAELKAMNEQIKELRREASEAGGEAKAEFEESLDDLEMKRRDIEERLERVRQETSEAWESFRTEADQALDDLRHAVRKAKGRLHDA
jgi:chromosome segregation ATPase